MKRLAFLVLGAALAGSVWAQTFAIRQPVEGARIRETYNVRIPARTVPGNAYIGIYVNARFIEAVRPDVEGQDFVYALDTRKLKIADGPTTIEAVLYLDRGDERPTQDISRTSVNVTVDNSASIVATVSQAQALLGSRGFEVPTEHEKFRFLFAVDNVYSNGDGMVRIKALPDKNRDYGFFRIPQEGNVVRKVYSNEMAPNYMRMTNKGREIFGTVAPVWAIDGTSGTARLNGFFLGVPFPILPSKRIKPGDVWQGAFSLGRVTADLGANRLSDVIPGRGSFEAVEYQRGIACARIRTSVASGAADLTNLGNLGFNQLNRSLRLDSVAWISLNGGVILRHEINFVQEALVDGTPGSFGPATPGAGTGRQGSGSGANPDKGSTGQIDWMKPIYDPQRDANGNWSLVSLAQQPPSGSQFGGGRPPEGGRFMGGVPPTGTDQTGRGNQVTRPRPVGRQIIRVSLNAVIELEK